MLNKYVARIRLFSNTGNCISSSTENPEGIYAVELHITDTLLDHGDKIEVVEIREVV